MSAVGSFTGRPLGGVALEQAVEALDGLVEGWRAQKRCRRALDARQRLDQGLCLYRRHAHAGIGNERLQRRCPVDFITRPSTHAIVSAAKELYTNFPA